MTANRLESSVTHKSWINITEIFTAANSCMTRMMHGAWFRDWPGWYSINYRVPGNQPLKPAVPYYHTYEVLRRATILPMRYSFMGFQKRRVTVPSSIDLTFTCRHSIDHSCITLSFTLNWHWDPEQKWDKIHRSFLVHKIRKARENQY